MTDYRAMFDRDYLGVWDLNGREVTVTISDVKAGEIGGQQGRKKEKKPIVSFEKTAKMLLCNKTNAKTIAGMYGNDVRQWIGKRVTLFGTTTTFGRETVECIRIRPAVPKNGKSAGIESRPVDPAIREQQDRAAGRDEDGPPMREPGEDE